MADRTYYDVLHVNPAAGDEEIKAAYRSLAWQPSGPAGQDELKLISEAYATLSSPQRRAAYDQALATGATVAPVPVAPAGALPTLDDVEERVPKGALPLRLWGMITDIVWHISRVRYTLIPFTWIIGGMLFFTGLYMVDGYRLAVNPHPLQTTIKEVVRQVPGQKYISVVGTANYAAGFSDKGNGREYHLIYTPGDLIFAKGPKGPSSGRFTGMLREFDGLTTSWVQQQTSGTSFENINVLTTYYLDLDYLPRAPGWYLLGVAGALLGLVVLFLPAVKRYTVFTSSTFRVAGSLGGQLQWPLRVEAVGTFRMEGRRRGKFHAGLPAVLAPAPDGGFTVSSGVRFRSGAEPEYQIMIPPGAPVQVGLDHAGGRARPALQVKIPGQTIYLRVDTPRDARLLAQAIRG